MGTQPPPVRPAPLLVRCGVILALLFGSPLTWDGAAAAQAPGPAAPSFIAKPPPPPPPPSGNQWLTFGFGFVPAGQLFIGDPDADPETFVEGETTGELPLLQIEYSDPAYRFTVGAHHRFRRVDLGLRLTHQGSNPVVLFERERRTPSAVQAQVTFRWRFVDRHWGALYGGVALGGFAAQQNEGFRASVAHHFEGPPHLDFTDERVLGGSASSALGLLLYDGDRVGFYVEVATNVAFADYRVHDRAMGMLSVDQGLNAGMAWSL